MCWTWHLAQAIAPAPSAALDLRGTPIPPLLSLLVRALLLHVCLRTHYSTVISEESGKSQTTGWPGGAHQVPGLMLVLGHG